MSVNFNSTIKIDTSKLERLKEALAQLGSMQYTPGVYQVSDFKKEILKYHLAGHNPALIGDNPTREEVFSMDDLVRRYNTPSQLLSNPNNSYKHMETFSKSVVVKCPTEQIKKSLVEYALSKNVPVYKDGGTSKEFPMLGWSSGENILCGYAPYSSRDILSIDKFIEFCDNWEELQMPEIKLNSEESVKIDYKNKLVLAGCNHQYKLPFSLIDEIYKKVHERDAKEPFNKLTPYSFVKIDNDSHDRIKALCQLLNIEFISKYSGNFTSDKIVLYLDKGNRIDWGLWNLLVDWRLQRNLHLNNSLTLLITSRNDPRNKY